MSEDELILRYYGESEPDATARIDRHLQACPECRDAWADVNETMKLVDAAEVPEPGDGFERVMWARVQQALPPQTSWWSFGRWIPAMSLGAAVVALVAVGLAWRPFVTPVDDRAATATRQAADSRERVLLTALDGHFEQAEMLLVELMNAPEASPAGLAFERTTADDLVASGRLYRATAEENGDVRLAEMLEELETVLVDVARNPQTLQQAELETLRGRIDDENLLFKVRAVTNEIRVRQQHLLTVSEGPL